MQARLTLPVPAILRLRSNFVRRGEEAYFLVKRVFHLRGFLPVLKRHFKATNYLHFVKIPPLLVWWARNFRLLIEEYVFFASGVL